jgi:hypothetical protein
MKTIIHKIAIAAALSTILLASSCNLDYAPQNTMVDETVYKSSVTSEAALMGAYQGMCSFLCGSSFPNAYTYMFADIGTPTLTIRSTYSTLLPMQTSLYTQSEHEGFILNSYRNGYNAIDYANAVIKGVTDYGSYADSLKTLYISEAKFIRAYCYMTLLSMFGDGALLGQETSPGLVLRLEPYDGYNPNLLQARSTNGEVYDQIIKDATEAMDGLPSTDYAAAQRYRATKNVVRAFLSRVYLYRGTFTGNAEYLSQSASYARQVLDSGAYTFSKAYNDHRRNIFPNNEYVNGTFPDPTVHSEELIFFDPSRYYSATMPCGVDFYFDKQSICANADFIASYSKGDLRGYVEGSDDCMIQHGSTYLNPSDFATMKYDNSEGYSDVIFIRLSEIKLTYAEASARASGSISADALRQLNDIRCKPYAAADKPSELKSSDFTSVDGFIAEVLKERAKELAFEGHYRWDLIRTGRSLKDTTVPDNRKALPIPYYEIKISEGKIVQNTGFASDAVE